MWSLPVIGLMVYALVYALSETVSRKTKGLVPSILFLCLVYLLGFLTGLFPKDAISATGIPALLSAFGTLCIVTNLGTLIPLRQFLREWRTVLICLGGISVLLAASVFGGGLFFDKTYALCAVPSLSGGVVAFAIILKALEGGASQYIVFCSLCFAVHGLVGIPAASWMLRKYCMANLHSAALLGDPLAPHEEDTGRGKLFHFSESGENQLLFARLTVIMALASVLAYLLHDLIPAAVLGLVLGVCASESGFLAPNTLKKCGYYDLMMFFMLAIAVDPLSSVDLSSLRACLAPLLFFLLVGVAGILLGGLLMGLLLRTDLRLSMALALACMLGFPDTLIVANDVVDALPLEKDECARVRDTVAPKMVIAGFATVSTASILIASFLAPLLS